MMAQPIHNLPIPDLDDKTFEELVNEARARIPLYAPKWTDHNLSDPGITFLELFAWLAEMQLYSLNQLPDRNYLKFLKLLNEKPAPAAPSRVDVTFCPCVAGGVNVPKGTPVVAREKATGEQIVFETDVDATVIPVKLEKVLSFVNVKYTDHTAANERVGVFYHAFGEAAQTGSILYLGFEGFDDSILGKQMRISVYLYESDLPASGAHDQERQPICLSPQLDWEYWQGAQWTFLPIKQDETMLFTHSGSIGFNVPSDIEQRQLPPFEEKTYNLFWIRCKVREGGYEIPPRIDTIKLNTVPATQGQTVKDEPLFRKDEASGPIEINRAMSSGLPYQVFQSQKRPILVGTQVVTVHEINGASNVWEARDDFDASGPEDNHYLLHPAEGEIEFGDGLGGRVPPKGSTITLTYRFGGGEIGNIPADTMWMPLQINDVQMDVKNELKASGGTEAESIEAAQARVRKGLKIPFRAVTAEDYESLVKSTPGLRVARAYAVPSPEENRATVTVVPYSPPELERPIPSQGFLDTVCRHLNQHRLLTTDLRIVQPEYVRVSVDAQVRIKLQNDPSAMEGKIVAALTHFLHPLTGGHDGKGWPFGRSVYQSEIYAVIEGVAGVDCVTRLALSATGNFQYQNGNIGIPPSHLVYSGAHKIEIQSPETVCKK